MAAPCSRGARVNFAMRVCALALLIIGLALHFSGNAACLRAATPTIPRMNYQ